MTQKVVDPLENFTRRNLRTIDRRRLMQNLGLAFLATLSRPSFGTFARASEESLSGGRLFPTPTNINHLSCTVANYAKTRDFYIDLFGMRLAWDDGKQCGLEFGNPATPNGLYLRPLSKATDKPDIGHIAFGIPNFMKYKAAIKTEMERYHLTGIRTDGEVGWTCNDPAGYMLNILIEKDMSVFPGAAIPCDVSASEKCKQAYAEGMKNLSAAPKSNGSGFKSLYFSHVVLNVPEVQFGSEFDFYRDMMGMKVIYERVDDNPQALLRFGKNTLYLQKTAKLDGRPYCNRFAFVVDNYNSSKVETTLKERGLDPKPDSKLAWAFTDPNGFRVEVAAPGWPEHMADDCKNERPSCLG